MYKSCIMRTLHPTHVWVHNPQSRISENPTIESGYNMWLKKFCSKLFLRKSISKEEVGPQKTESAQLWMQPIDR